MTRRARVVAGVLGLALVAAGAALAPGWLRTLEFFQVRRVDVVGLRYLEGRQVALAMRLPAGASLFDEVTPLGRRVLAMPGVQQAEVSRRWPATLVVEVTEWVPVALAPVEDRLALLDRLGRPLPFDPSKVPADVPLAVADPVVAGGLDRIRQAAPPLFGRIIAAERYRASDVLLDLEGRRVLVRGDVSATDLRNLELVLADLERKRLDCEELDARFGNRVFVRGMRSVTL